MSARAEELMREVRVKLGQAELCERRGEIEIADAYGAVAANKLARVVSINNHAADLEAIVARARRGMVPV